MTAVALLLWAVYSSISYSLEHAPAVPSTDLAYAADDGPSPVEALSEAAIDSRPTLPPRPPGRAWPAGSYSVGDSPDVRIASRDRDYRSRTPVFIAAEDVASGGSSDGEQGDRSSDSRDRDRDRDDDDGEAVEREPRIVRGEIEPGLYSTSYHTTDCTYELWRVMRTRQTEVIAEDYLANGRLLVTINGIEPDWFTSTETCGNWYRWSALPEPLIEAGDGDYWIGDLAQGVWLVPKSCRWEKVVAFRGAQLHDVVDGGSGPGSLVIDEDTYGVRLRGCRSPISLSTTADQAALAAP